VRALPAKADRVKIVIERCGERQVFEADPQNP
jgi:hypothetical protein